MTLFTSPASPTSARAPRRRWIGLLVVSALLHLIFISWANGNIGLPAWPEQNAPIMTAELKTIEAPRAPAALPPPPKPPVAQKKVRPKPARPAPAAAPPVALTRPAVDTSPPSPVDSQAVPEGMAAPGSSTEPAVEIPVAETPPAPEEKPVEPAPAVAAAPQPPPAPKETAEKRYKVSPPPSAELKYDVQALRDGKLVYGHGKFNWQSQGSNYTATGEAGILFFTILNFKSQGEINEFGVAPVLYSEKGFRKSETNTHFHRERNTISFSASEASYPRKGGEQDRASVIWQLVGIGRGDSEKFIPGAEINIFVAGVRDAEAWNIRVLGQEEITVGTGRTTAWHIARVPRPGTYDKKIEIWLAPQQEWYPVKVRYTETNGDYLDMVLSNVNISTARAPVDKRSERSEY